MMYSEFLRLGGEKVKGISFIEFSEMIEPLQLYCDLNKRAFVESLVRHFDEAIVPLQEKVINHLSDESKADIARGEEYIAEYLPTVALETRKLVYQLMKVEALIIVEQ